jgi:hypothetical protein
VGTDDTIQVRCSRCKSKFRDKARRVRDGYSRQCPTCECMVFFLDGSPNNDIQDALREAERVRKVLREEESEQTVSRAESTEQTESGERVSAFARRGISRRSLPAGRARR